MPYRVQHTGVGPWQEGQIVSDADLDAAPFKAKYLRVGGLVKVSAEAAPAPAEQQGALADLDAQLATLTAQRAALLGAPPDPTAPAAVTYELDAAHPPTAADAAATRALGAEVLQPSPGAPVQGTVVPGEAAASAEAPTPKAGKK